MSESSSADTHGVIAGEDRRATPEDSAQARALVDDTDRRFPARPFVAASCLVVREQRILLAQRAAPPLVWSAPGGVVEAGESLEAAALRELREETGVTAAIIGLAGHLEHIAFERGGAAPADANDRVLRHYVIMCFAARWSRGDGQISAEAPALAWVSPQQAAMLPATPGLIGLMHKALAMAQ